ncbi:MAG: class I SAM-dependent methyltransferase, partial [Pseudomonadota bacterium]
MMDEAPADGVSQTLGPNDWKGALGQTWAANLQALEAQWAATRPLGLATLAPQPGERILDIGCGGARTTRAIGEAVAADGSVLGLDISSELVGVANQGLRDLPQASAILADAALYGFDGGAWDAVFSRFGVMFFEKPVAAFRNIRSALKRGGRAVFVVHADRKLSPWASLPAQIAAEVLGPPEPTPPGAAGPFGWESPEIFAPILEDAGFADIAWDTHPIEGPMGSGLDPDPVTAALLMVRNIGVVARRLSMIEDEGA